MLSHFLRAAQKTPIIFIASSFAQNAAIGATLAINKPTNTLEGDLMVAIAGGAGSNSWTVPSGWTETLDSVGRLAAYKVATASEPSSYTFTYSVATQIIAGYILTYRNAAWDTVGTVSVAAQNPTASSITVAQNNSVVLCYADAQSVVSTYTTPAGFTLVTEDTVTAPTSAIFSKISSLGATGTVTVNGSATGTPSRAFLLSIKPTTNPILIIGTTTYFLAASTANLTMNVPTGTSLNDLMIAWLTKSGGSDTYTQPAGWTELIDIGTANNSFMVAYKVASASEAGSYNWVSSATGQNKAGNIVTFRNASYDATAGASYNLTTTAPSLTATFNNSWLVLIGRSRVASATITFSGATTIVSDSDVDSPSSVIQYLTFNSGATGTIAGTYSTATDPISASIVIYNS